jgi:hypothetical protein
MPDIKVEDLVRSIREQARESAAQQTAPSASMLDSSAQPLARLQTSLTITGRAQDQLPPVSSYRSGLPARIELWIKRFLKRVTHWYTWEQVNFNSSVDRALNNILAILQTNELRLANLQNELDVSLVSNADLESRLSELESRLTLFEKRCEAVLAEKIAEVRIEHQSRIEALLNEQRICFRQLALEVREAGLRVEHPPRSVQVGLKEPAGDVDQINAE